MGECDDDLAKVLSLFIGKKTRKKKRAQIIKCYVRLGGHEQKEIRLGSLLESDSTFLL